MRVERYMNADNTMSGVTPTHNVHACGRKILTHPGGWSEE